MTVWEDNFLVPGTIFLVFLLVALAMFAFWVWSLVDALRLDDRRWVAAGQSKILWVVLIAVLGLLGSILYLFMARPAVTRQA